MTEAEVEPLVLDAVRRYSGNDAVTAQSRFQQDLRMSDAGRQMLFASLAQTFTARGVSLASNGFLMRDFLACATPADVREAVVAKVFGRAVIPARKPTSPPASATASSPAPAPASAPAAEVPAVTAAPAKAKATARRKPVAKKVAPKKAKAAAKRPRR
jgi:hypothetical protein